MPGILTYTLIQETPMIHFQYSESGAILRASDVKPRLDKFLIRQMEDDEKKRFKISDDYPALDYKLQVLTNGEPEIKNPDKISRAYFGNMKNTNRASHKKTVFYTEPILLKIICFHPELRELIDKHIRGFFLLHNFGTRQDKGFGSFRIQNDQVPAAELFKKYALTEGYTAYCIDDGQCQSIGHLDNADIFYKLLKSGINFSGKLTEIKPEPERYVKSLLTSYMLDRKIGGEKRWMKQKGIAPAIGKSSWQDKYYTTISDFKYVRAVLGIGDHQDWKKDVNEKRPSVTINITPAKGNPVQRYQSPLTFTVYNDTLYVIAYKPNPVIFGQAFEFWNKDDSESKKMLSVVDNFDMEDFMGYVRDHIGSHRVQYYGGGIYKFSMTEVSK